MRILSMHIMKWNSENDSLFLSSVDDLSFVSWLQRSFFREGVRFGARTACNRTKVGEPLSLSLPDSQAKCYIYVNKNQLAGLVIADDQYPERIAFMIVSKLLREFE
jgi:synaptobrevin family protein YKT6